MCSVWKCSLTKEAFQAINFSGDKSISPSYYPLHDFGVIGCNPGIMHSMFKKQINTWLKLKRPYQWQDNDCITDSRIIVVSLIFQLEVRSNFLCYGRESEQNKTIVTNPDALWNRIRLHLRLNTVVLIVYWMTDTSFQGSISA